MRFYTRQHVHYCGIDLHARSLYTLHLRPTGQHPGPPEAACEAEQLLKALAPYERCLVVAVECLFCWYWVADLCSEQGIEFVLGHALYMKAIHGGKTKNDRLDSYKIAALLRGGNLPYAYVYPRQMRATRDLLRRRLFFARKRGSCSLTSRTPTPSTTCQPWRNRPDKAKDRGAIVAHFDDDTVQMSIAADVALLDGYDQVIRDMKST